MAAQPVSSSNATVMLIPSNGPRPSVIQGGQAFPGMVIQPAMPVQYVPYGGQEYRSATNQPHQKPYVGPLEKLLKVETKTLGAIQIMIGLIHLGFGLLLVLLGGPMFYGLALIVGYPFWGGVFFILSGSFSVNAVKHLSVSQVKCSVGMNIMSAITALTGICLYITEFVLSSVAYSYYNQYLLHHVNVGFSALLFLFSLLEFCITVSSAHFGCQATCYNNEMAVHQMSYTVIGGVTGFPESSAPPPYNPYEPFAATSQAY